MSPEMKEPSAKPKYWDGALVPETDEHGSSPVVIRLTDEERNSGRTRPDTIQQALTYYHRDGFFVLENAIDDDLVDKLYNRMVEDNETYLSKPHMTWNQGSKTKNVSQIPPLTTEWLHKDFYANVHVLRILENLLGPQPELRFLNANVACPGGTGRQAVHTDVNHRFPSIPFGIVLNTYLQDSSADNGVTEVWCGTHNAYPHPEQLKHKESGWIRKDLIQDRAKKSAPSQPHIRKGSICFRDLRLWHAGMPNPSSRHRIMLAIDYFAAWYQCPMTLQLPLSAKEMVEKEWKISTKGIEWVDGEIDSLEVPFFLNMTQDPGRYLVQTEKGFEDWRVRESGKYEFDRGVVSEECYWTPE
ncbi:hypothetical protein B0A55_01720 [Friedmanniomyces simplex]|uniref:Phytanoyl-CoA dioxygenase family protein n=1 Tax=Friedmanniomyces simplex TaxID=329884 RepID=A0A4U0Y110_9PEZI|nr:hypothetical protein B0A55_01720 [Friedmanniomyces simplex]